MQNLSGYEEKQIEVRGKIDNELKTLPSIFSEYVDYLVDQNRAISTVHRYLTTLTGCLRTIYQDFYLSDDSFYKNLSTADVAYYFDAKSNLSTKALQVHWSVLNSFFAFLVEKEYLPTNPMQGIKRPIDRNTNRKLNYLSQDEFSRLLSTVRRNPTKFTAFRDEIIIKLAVSTGLDITDMVNLNFDHIDFLNSTIRVVSKKGERLIPVGDSILSLLKRWNQFREVYFKGNDTPALFISSKKSRLSVDAVGEMLRKYCEQANVPQITFKDLKSTMVYLLARQNVSMDAIMKFLDVSDYLMVVQAYDAAMKEHDVNIHDVLNSLFDAPLSQKQGNDGAVDQHNFSVEVRPPEYSTYTKGGAGFTVYANITNLIDAPIKLKLKSCTIYTNGMLRTCDYIYTGYEFDEEFIFPKTARTFGRIWITDDLPRKQLRHGEYMLLRLIDMDSNVEHHIKYVFTESQLGNAWMEESWYEVNQ